jgi:GcrA cell cycle regulator
MDVASPWTEELCQFLAENWNKASKSQIVQMIDREYGVRVSRAAVIGKGHRLGLVDEKRARSGPRVTAKPAKPVDKKTVMRLPNLKANPPAFECRTAPVAAKNLTLLDLTDDTCKYPSGTVPAEMTFCGHQPLPGGPYCAAHARICFLEGNRGRARA